MNATSSRNTLLAVFFVSGACALVYQVLWVRLLILQFGATSLAVALVLATFMAGLGLGSLIGSRVTHRLRSPIRAYALIEAAIGVAALAMPWAIRSVGGLQATLLPLDASYAAGLFLEGALCFGLLLVPTTCMGATLPILSRWIARDEATRGRDLGTLYSVNTLGAFLGTVFAGFVAIETLGIAATNAGAALANFIVAGLAVALARGQADVPPSAPPGKASTPPGLVAILVLGAAAGFLGLAHEVVWTRLVGLVLVTTTYAYTTILATVIGGIGVGSWLGAKAADRAEDPVRWFGQLQLGIGLAALGIFPLLLVVLRRVPWILDSAALPFAQGQLLTVGVCVGLMAVPAVLMGATFPALARAVTTGSEDVGRQVGRLYIWNTLAGVGGSLAAGFALLPTVGVLGSVQLLAGGNLVVGAWTARPRPGATQGRRAWAVLVLAAVLLAGGTAGRVTVEDLYLARLPAGSEILHLSEGVTSTVMVADHTVPPVRRIWIQSVWVAGTGGSHRMLGHLSMLHSPARSRAVGIAFGTGQSFASARLHDLEHLDCVDLNRDMVDAGSRWFAEHNDRLLEQDGVQIVINDGRSFLARGGSDYDAVLMEPLQPWSAGAVNLYTREFYELAAARLRPGGTLTQWMPIDDIPPEITRSVVGTLASVFPDTWVYLDNYDLWIVGSKDGGAIDVSAWRRRLEEPRIGAELSGIKYGDVESILGTLLVGPADVADYVGDAPLQTDDRPFMEFVAPRTMGGAWFTPNVEALLEACSSPLAGIQAPAADRLPSSLEDCELGSLLARVNVAHEEGDLVRSRDLAREAFKVAPAVQRAVGYYRDRSNFLAAKLEKAGDLEGAILVYRQHLDDDDGFLGIRLNLALLQARAGRIDEAIGSLEPVEHRTGPFAAQVALALREFRARVAATPPAVPVPQPGPEGPDAPGDPAH